jgi:uncharacterized protein
MQASRYNFFFDADDGTHLAFNALSGGMAALSGTEYRQVKQILAHPKTYRFNTKARKELRDELYRGHFIIEDEIDERDILKVRYWKARFDQSHLRLTILPTLRCNFRCIYCFEARKNSTMSRKTQDAVVAFVRKKVAKADDLIVNWYGGEPLLTLDIISRLGGEFQKICDAVGCRYHPGGIVTNGYLLDRKMCRRLKEVGIETAQVTLDGPRTVHDQRRPLANGRGTFDRIMDNVCQAVDVIKRITIRINTDKTNADRVLELLDGLEERGLRQRVSIYFGKVRPYTEVCANIAEDCFLDQEYGRLEVELVRRSLERGFRLAEYPRPKTHYCSTDHGGSYVLGPMGYVYKCWAESGDVDHAVGHLEDTKSKKEHELNRIKWLTWDIFERKECRECNLLPICMGGCPYEGKKLKATARGACERWKYNLLDMLKVYYTRFCAVSGTSPALTASGVKGGEMDEMDS